MAPPQAPSLPEPDAPPAPDAGGQAKKKKKKRAKKPAAPAPPPPPALDAALDDGRPGPWLQLPIELLDSLFVLNCDPATLALPHQNDAPNGRSPSPPDAPPTPSSRPRQSQPPIDPGVFRSVLTVRRLVEEATDLAIRAASGLSAAALSANTWGNGGGLFGEPATNCGRSVTMSATRAHRLRALAVQRLAQAYKTDEIAASVMVMQGATSLDDIAERVLAVDPKDLDAQYVHFFHEKIPSRQLAESTTTQVLDQLINARPQYLEYFRTRGIVYCFREEYSKAVRDFTHALKEARAARKARHAHAAAEPKHRAGKSKRNGAKTKAKAKLNGQAPPDGTAAPDPPPPDPEPIELQLLFLRGAAYLQHAVCLVERVILELEQVRKPGLGDSGADMRLSYIENGRYGGLEIGHPDGPLGERNSVKVSAYRVRMGGDAELREGVEALGRKAIRDAERFLAHFDNSSGAALSDTESLATALVPRGAGTPGSDAPFVTYHPLIVEAHFSILIAHLLLGDFTALLPALVRCLALVDGLEGYPVFLPARSMAQAEFLEILDRLSACRWASPELAGAAEVGSPLACARAVVSKRAADVDPRSPSSLNFAMHGPRVEVVLAWLAALHLPALDAEAETLFAAAAITSSDADTETTVSKSEDGTQSLVDTDELESQDDE
ncbi:hypothetical protein AURDEDRAFT_179652 [Auricularia subglabra TFB-10046 SS5]|nr:hypothetical protein AURDEDRAFT_179652 [Auricularia subglabra TFB-10046 SS5]